MCFRGSIYYISHASLFQQQPDIPSLQNIHFKIHTNFSRLSINLAHCKQITFNQIRKATRTDNLLFRNMKAVLKTKLNLKKVQKRGGG